METSLSVNFKNHLTTEVNSFKLSKLRIQILQYLYNNKEKTHQQVEIIKSICGKTTPAKKVSFSRAIKKLIECDFVDSRKAYYSDQLNCWISQRVCYFITEKGEQFVEKNWLEI